LENAMQNPLELSSETLMQLQAQASTRNLSLDAYLQRLLEKDAQELALEKTRGDVIKILHQHLDDVEIDDRSENGSTVRILLREESVYRGEHAWRVWVCPSREPRRWEYIHEELAAIAETIAEATGYNTVIRCDDPLPNS
jgi:hypothetical protein